MPRNSIAPATTLKVSDVLYSVCHFDGMVAPKDREALSSAGIYWNPFQKFYHGPKTAESVNAIESLGGRFVEEQNARIAEKAPVAQAIEKVASKAATASGKTTAAIASARAQFVMNLLAKGHSPAMIKELVELAFG